MPIRKEIGEILWVYYCGGRGVANGSGKNKGDLGMGGIKNQERGACLFRVRELL